MAPKPTDRSMMLTKRALVVFVFESMGVVFVVKPKRMFFFRAAAARHLDGNIDPRLVLQVKRNKTGKRAR